MVATGETEARPEIVFDVLSDFEHYPEFMPYVKESRVLSREGNKRGYHLRARSAALRK